MGAMAALWHKFQKSICMLLAMKEIKLLAKGFWRGEHNYCPIVVCICFLFNERLQKLEGLSLTKLFNVLEVCVSRSRGRTRGRNTR